MLCVTLEMLEGGEDISGVQEFVFISRCNYHLPVITPGSLVISVVCIMLLLVPSLVELIG